MNCTRPSHEHRQAHVLCGRFSQDMLSSYLTVEKYIANKPQHY